MDCTSVIINVVVTMLALISAWIAWRANKLAARGNQIGVDSIVRLEEVKKEIENEFAEIQNVNQETQGLIRRIRLLVDASEQQGLEMLYANRMDALKEFKTHIESEDTEVIIVGSSLLGVLMYISDFDKMIQSNPKKFKFILTHPDDSVRREAAEGRDPGRIGSEIREKVHQLIEWCVPKENIQLYKGSPTVFMIATKRHMLLNPYPYGVEAYKCFCMQFAAGYPVYERYYERHYSKIWDSVWVETWNSYEQRFCMLLTPKKDCDDPNPESSEIVG